MGRVKETVMSPFTLQKTPSYPPQPRHTWSGLVLLLLFTGLGRSSWPWPWPWWAGGTGCTTGGSMGGAGRFSWGLRLMEKFRFYNWDGGRSRGQRNNDTEINSAQTICPAPSPRGAGGSRPAAMGAAPSCGGGKSQHGNSTAGPGGKVGASGGWGAHRQRPPHQAPRDPPTQSSTQWTHPPQNSPQTRAQWTHPFHNVPLPSAQWTHP